jgi:hypothetical protein
MELIAVPIPNIKYGDLLQIAINPFEIEIIEATA